MYAKKGKLWIRHWVNQVLAQMLCGFLELEIFSFEGNDFSRWFPAAHLGDAVGVQASAIHRKSAFDLSLVCFNHQTIGVLAEPDHPMLK